MNKHKDTQLRWVVLLLAVAVILPTVCLLWFMTQTVKNERLAVKQRLINIYKSHFETALQETENKYLEFIEKYRTSLKGETVAEIFAKSVGHGNIFDKLADCMLIFDANGKLAYPTMHNEIQYQSPMEDKFTKAEQLENIDSNSALSLYRSILADANSSIDVKRVQLAEIRILRKTDKYKQALEVCKAVIQPVKQTNYAIDYLRACGKIIYCEITKELAKSDPCFIENYRFAVNDASRFLICYDPNTEMYLNLTSDERAALGCRLIDIGGRKFDIRQFIKVPFGEDPNKYIEEPSFGQVSMIEDYNDINSIQPLSPYNSDEMVRAENSSLQMADKFNWSDFEKFEEKIVYELSDCDYYGSVLNIDNLHCVIFRVSRLPHPLEMNIFPMTMKLSDKTIWQNLIAWPSHCSAETRPQSELLFELPVSRYCPGWKIEVYPANDEFLSKFADKRIMLYVWTGLLVILLILCSGAMATGAIGRQAKLNKLKNDFIATITHELKTPLASMRVLVDTLLEGRCESQQQEKEYLQLIAKENLRLSGLIDNFLTFSRMERNKQAFNFEPVSPADIANAAAGAVQTKFNAKNCKFSVTIADDLPSIMADKDAMATVLVNLFDNACKYSNEDKRIELNVFADDGYVCFVVGDNGIGMTRGQMKRIFDRFYQADTSLARRAEGAGLGLSIVKFIVDAHKGKIDVESKPGKGSRFTVRIGCRV